MSTNNNRQCDSCARTGILTAQIVHDEETGKKSIAVCVCEHASHKKPEMALRSVEAMMKETGLPVIVRETPLRPYSWGDDKEESAVSAA